MTKIQEDIRKYSMSDASMVRSAQQIAAFSKRDMKEFAQYGITQSVLADFESECNQFEMFVSDEIMEGRQTEITARKEKLAAKVIEILRGILLRVELKFGKNSPQTKMYKIGDLSRLNDDLLLAAARRTHIQATTHLLELSAHGLTQAILDELLDLSQQFENAQHDRAILVSERDNLTEERVRKGNALYEKLTKLSDIGKQVWGSQSESRYNDYVIYERSSGSEDKTDEAASPSEADKK